MNMHMNMTASTAVHHHHSPITLMEQKRSFPLLSIDIKIQAPDGLVGRLIGKNGSVLQKIMDETLSVITVMNDGSMSQTDRVISIRAQTLENALAAERRVTQKLQQDLEHDIRAGINYNYHPHSSQTPAGYGLATMETVVPQYYNASGTPTISRENASYQSFGSSLPSIQPYGSMPIAVGAPAIYYHQPNTMANYVISHHNPVQLPHIQTNAIIKSRLYVPESMIGSLIGSKGQNIKNMMQMTSAIIQIEGENRKRDLKSCSQADEKLDAVCEMADEVFDETKGIEKIDIKATVTETDKKSPEAISIENGKTTPSGNGTKPSETPDEKPDGAPSTSSKNQLHRAHSENNNCDSSRGVFISGYDYQVYKAQFMIFQKISENTRRYFDECVLPCEAIVPTKCIGRIIGRGGANVRELQMITNAVIKIPDTSGQNNAETPVKITGNFHAFQLAQARIGALVADTEIKESKEYEGKRSARNSSSTYKPNVVNGRNEQPASTPNSAVPETAKSPNS